MNKNFARFLTINFITSLIIAYVACFILETIGLKDVLFIGNLFGIYYLIIYGLNIAVENGYIKNDYKRSIFALVYVILFDIIFIALMPLLFGYNLFLPADYIAFILNGFEFNLLLNSFFYMIIFTIIILIFNYILSRSETRI